ncbi:MAG: hypothetical protein PHI97_00660 [Desulfobulbus sp.]|jgi:hypothetical protein|nr:hypothetical protein [Desulfobulbus sp.]
MLTLPINRIWFDKIASREKPEEYRKISPYYAARFDKHEGSPFPLRLRAGYRADSPLLECVARANQGEGRVEWGAEPGVQYYVLALSDVVVLLEGQKKV